MSAIPITKHKRVDAKEEVMVCTSPEDSPPEVLEKSSENHLRTPRENTDHMGKSDVTYRTLRKKEITQITQGSQK